MLLGHPNPHLPKHRPRFRRRLGGRPLQGLVVVPGAADLVADHEVPMRICHMAGSGTSKQGEMWLEICLTTMHVMYSCRHLLVCRAAGSLQLRIPEAASKEAFLQRVTVLAVSAICAGHF